MNPKSNVVALRQERLVRVTCDGLPEGFSVKAFWNGMRWNGFVTPLFTLEAAKTLCAVLPELSYDAQRHALLYVDVPADALSHKWIHPTQHVIEGNSVELFLIGDSWCWELVRSESALPNLPRF